MIDFDVLSIDFPYYNNDTNIFTYNINKVIPWPIMKPSTDGARQSNDDVAPWLWEFIKLCYWHFFNFKTLRNLFWQEMHNIRKIKMTLI